MTSIITVKPIDASNFRMALDLEVTHEQTAWVASTARYLALCGYGGLWHALGLYAAEEMVGFAMWARDDTDGSHWIGGLLIDRRQQRRGYGRAAVEALTAWLRREHAATDIALSYHPANEVARHLYASLGFVETGEHEGDEVVARLRASEGT
jgi:diamine N-acetyltransferase